MRVKLLALLLLAAAVAQAQNLVKGRVLDEGGQPLPGVNIVIKGTSQGTVSDADGSFAMNDVASGATLVFSFIGYSSMELVYTGQASVEARLTLDVTALQEVVVVGYGTSTVKELTGSVASVSGQALGSINPVRMDQALQGKAAGVQINAATGAPGGNFYIRIRGYTTNGDNNPLLVVDGIPYPTEGLGSLNPADIETIDILKDGTAGIYGVRAANGVIMVTTKQGRRNSKPQVEFNTYVGQQETSNQLHLLNAREFAILKNEMHAAGLQPVPYANVELGEGTDWQGAVFGKASIQNHTISVSGGTEKSTYSIGGSYYGQNGIVGDGKAAYERYNGRINFTTEIMPKLTFINTLLYTNEWRTTLPESVISSVLYNAINASPIAAPYTPTGTFSYLTDVNDVINPLAQIANSFNEATTNKLFGRQELSYKVNDQFSVNARAGYAFATVDYKGFSPLVYYGPSKAQNTAADADLNPIIASRLASVTESNTRYIDYNLEAFVNYQATFNSIHKVRATLGTSFVEANNRSLTGIGFGVPYNSWDFADISLTEEANPNNRTYSGADIWRLQSFFLRGEYSHKGKYMISGVIRRDGSSRFGPNNRFGYFPSASAAWIVSEENFLGSDLIEFLKVRASYGIIGNDKIGTFSYRGALGGEGVYAFDDLMVTGRAFGRLSNPDLKWETTHQTNIGTDITVLGGALDVTLDYYIKQTYDLLFVPDVSAMMGAYGAGGAAPYVNNGDVRNSGFELSLNYAKKIGSKLTLTANYNLTTIKNEVTRLPEGVTYQRFGSFSVGGGTISRMQVGYPMGAFFGHQVEGVYQTQTEITERGLTQNGAAPKPGDFRFANINGDTDVDVFGEEDKTFLGSPIPELIMGSTIGLNFSGFDFSTTLYASIGNEIVRNYERQQPLANTLDYRINRWTGEGSTNEHPRLTTELNSNNIFSSYFVEDGSFLRIRNLQLGYTIPQGIVKKAGLRNLRVYVAANNLATFTRYMGYDPDFATDSPLVSGVDMGYYPQARTYMAGLSLNF